MVLLPADQCTQLKKEWVKNGDGLGIAFASFAVICSFATGNAIQSFTVSDQIYSEVTQVIGTGHFLTFKHFSLGRF